LADSYLSHDELLYNSMGNSFIGRLLFITWWTFVQLYG